MSVNLNSDYLRRLNSSLEQCRRKDLLFMPEFSPAILKNYDESVDFDIILLDERYQRLATGEEDRSPLKLVNGNCAIQGTREATCSLGDYYETSTTAMPASIDTTTTSFNYFGEPVLPHLLQPRLVNDESCGTPQYTTENSVCCQQLVGLEGGYSKRRSDVNYGDYNKMIDANYGNKIIDANYGKMIDANYGNKMIDANYFSFNKVSIDSDSLDQMDVNCSTAMQMMGVKVGRDKALLHKNDCSCNSGTSTNNFRETEIKVMNPCSSKHMVDTTTNGYKQLASSTSSCGDFSSDSLSVNNTRDCGVRPISGRKCINGNKRFYNTAQSPFWRTSSDVPAVRRVSTSALGNSTRDSTNEKSVYPPRQQKLVQNFSGPSLESIKNAIPANFADTNAGRFKHGMLLDLNNNYRAVVPSRDGLNLQHGEFMVDPSEVHFEHGQIHQDRDKIQNYDTVKSFNKNNKKDDLKGARCENVKVNCDIKQNLSREAIEQKPGLLFSRIPMKKFISDAVAVSVDYAGRTGKNVNNNDYCAEYSELKNVSSYATIRRKCHANKLRSQNDSFCEAIYNPIPIPSPSLPLRSLRSDVAIPAVSIQNNRYYKSDSFSSNTKDSEPLQTTLDVGENSFASKNTKLSRTVPLRENSFGKVKVLNSDTSTASGIFSVKDLLDQHQQQQENSKKVASFYQSRRKSETAINMNPGTAPATSRNHSYSLLTIPNKEQFSCPAGHCSSTDFTFDEVFTPDDQLSKEPPLTSTRLSSLAPDTLSTTATRATNTAQNSVYSDDSLVTGKRKGILHHSQSIAENQEVEGISETLTVARINTPQQRCHSPRVDEVVDHILQSGSLAYISHPLLPLLQQLVSLKKELENLPSVAEVGSLCHHRSLATVVAEYYRSMPDQAENIASVLPRTETTVAFIGAPPPGLADQKPRLKSEDLAMLEAVACTHYSIVDFVNNLSRVKSFKRRPTEL